MCWNRLRWNCWRWDTSWVHRTIGRCWTKSFPDKRRRWHLLLLLLSLDERLDSSSSWWCPVLSTSVDCPCHLFCFNSPLWSTDFFIDLSFSFLLLFILFYFIFLKWWTVVKSVVILYGATRDGWSLSLMISVVSSSHLKDISKYHQICWLFR